MSPPVWARTAWDWGWEQHPGMWGAGGGPCPPRGDKATARHSSGSLQENHTSHHNTQGCIPQNHSAEGLQPYGGCDVRGGEVLAPSVEGPRSQTPPVGKRGCAGGLCSLPAPSGEGGSSWAAPYPWAPRVWGLGAAVGWGEGFSSGASARLAGRV